MDVADDLRPCDRQEIVIAFEVALPVTETITAKIVFAEPESLDHLYQLGLVYGYDKGNLTQALALFEEILSRQPDEELRATVDEELRKLAADTG